MMDIEHQTLEKDVQQIELLLDNHPRNNIEDNEEEIDSDDQSNVVLSEPWTAHQSISPCAAYECSEDEEEELGDSLETALTLNLAYQELLREQMELVKDLIKRNAEKQKEGQDSLQDEISDQVVVFKELAILIAPYFKNAASDHPAKNSDTVQRETLFPLLEAPKILTQNQEEILMSSLTQQMKDKCIRDLNLRLRRVRQNSAPLEGDTEENLRNAIREVNNNFSLADLPVEDVLEQADWLTIANHHLDGAFSAESCMAMYRTVCHLGVNRGRWTEAEDKKLAQLIDKHQATDWQLIAEELQTGRTAFLCFQRYQQKLRQTASVEWTEERIQKLMNAAGSHIGFENRINWDKVAVLVDSMTPQDCRQKWDELNTGTAGKWSPNEDLRLTEAVKLYGMNWMRVAAYVGTRSSQQSRERWMNALDPKIKRVKWKIWEDRILYKHIKESIGSQSERDDLKELRRQLGSRTGNSITQRLKVLRKRMARGKLTDSMLFGDEVGDENAQFASLCSSKTPFSCMEYKEGRLQNFYNKSLLSTLRGITRGLPCDQVTAEIHECVQNNLRYLLEDDSLGLTIHELNYEARNRKAAVTLKRKKAAPPVPQPEKPEKPTKHYEKALDAKIISLLATKCSKTTSADRTGGNSNLMCMQAEQILKMMNIASAEQLKGNDSAPAGNASSDVDEAKLVKLMPPSITTTGTFCRLQQEKKRLKTIAAFSTRSVPGVPIRKISAHPAYRVLLKCLKSVLLWPLALSGWNPAAETPATMPAFKQKTKMYRGMFLPTSDDRSTSPLAASQKGAIVLPNLSICVPPESATLLNITSVPSLVRINSAEAGETSEGVKKNPAVIRRQMAPLKVAIPLPTQHEGPVANSAQASADEAVSDRLNLPSTNKPQIVGSQKKSLIENMLFSVQATHTTNGRAVPNDVAAIIFKALSEKAKKAEQASVGDPEHEKSVSSDSTLTTVGKPGRRHGISASAIGSGGVEVIQLRLVPDVEKPTCGKRISKKVSTSAVHTQSAPSTFSNLSTMDASMGCAERQLASTTKAAKRKIHAVEPNVQSVTDLRAHPTQPNDELSVKQLGPKVLGNVGTLRAKRLRKHESVHVGLLSPDRKGFDIFCGVADSQVLPFSETVPLKKLNQSPEGSAAKRKTGHLPTRGRPRKNRVDSSSDRSSIIGEISSNHSAEVFHQNTVGRHGHETGAASLDVSSGGLGKEMEQSKASSGSEVTVVKLKAEDVM